jgi:hypothetical protein
MVCLMALFFFGAAAGVLIGAVPTFIIIGLQ